MLKHCAGLVALLALAAPGVAQDPEAEIRFNAGVRMLREGFPERALAEIQQALNKDPQNAFYLKGLGITYSREKSPPIAKYCALLRKNFGPASRKGRAPLKILIEHTT